MESLKLADAPRAHTIAPAADSDAPNDPDSDAAGALSIGPLVEWVKRRGGLDFWVTDADARAFYRARQRGSVTPEEADRLAIAIAREHPCAIWGWDDWVASAE